MFIQEHACKDFRCAQKEYCISPDLLCDQVNHCSDGSDEGVSANCKSMFRLFLFIYQKFLSQAFPYKQVLNQIYLPVKYRG